jgi:large subunit ribosomal protein L9
MKVILMKDFEKLGKYGELKDVKDGYARNFLIPKGIVCFAVELNIKRLNEEKRTANIKKEKRLNEMQSLQKKLNKISITIESKTGEEGKLFGSVTSEDIVSALKEQHDIEIDKHQIVFDQPIKQTGVHKVAVHLMENINAEMKVWVVEAKE